MREALDEFIGVTPQTLIDIDDIARRSRTIRRRRRGAALCLAGLAVLGAAAVGVTVAPRGDRALPPPAATRPAVTPSAVPAPEVAEPDRLLAALKAAIGREAPAVTGVDGLKRQLLQCAGGSGHKYVTEAPGVKTIPCPDRDGKPEALDRDYSWFGVLETAKGTYNVRLKIFPSQYTDPSAPPVDATDAEERRIAAEQGDAPKRGPNGEFILVDNSLNMVKPDGTGILIRTWDTDDSVPGSATRGPFTPAQLTAIGLDPALHL